MRATPNEVYLSGGCSSVGRAPDCDSGCRGFKPHQSPHSSPLVNLYIFLKFFYFKFQDLSLTPVLSSKNLQLWLFRGCLWFNISFAQREVNEETTILLSLKRSVS